MGPDGSALAFIKFDESAVKTYHMNMFRGQYPAYEQNALYPSNYSYKYPKAGEANSIVSVHVYDIKDRVSTPMNIGEEADIYIPRIKWTKDPKKISYHETEPFPESTGNPVGQCPRGKYNRALPGRK